MRTSPKVNCNNDCVEVGCILGVEINPNSRATLTMSLTNTTTRALVAHLIKIGFSFNNKGNNNNMNAT